ncbi:MAG: hypothetical protein PHY92_05720 [Alphaproteobacteria bacterium]|nr:hypothetical protein [Alphaproteobacteria bacterium]
MSNELEKYKKDFFASLALAVASDEPEDRYVNNLFSVIRNFRGNVELYMKTLPEIKERFGEMLDDHFAKALIEPESKDLLRFISIVSAVKKAQAPELLAETDPRLVTETVKAMAKHVPHHTTPPNDDPAFARMTDWATETVYFLSGLMAHEHLMDAFQYAYDKLGPAKWRLMQKEFGDWQAIKSYNDQHKYAKHIMTYGMYHMLKLADPGRKQAVREFNFPPSRPTLLERLRNFVPHWRPES